MEIAGFRRGVSSRHSYFMSRQRHPGSKGMGFWSSTSIGVGAMIGAGLFALVGISVDLTGKLAWLSFMIAGIFTLFTTYSVSRLAIRYPSKAGIVKYLNEAFPRGIAAGSMNVMMWIGYIVVTSLYARAFGEYGIALMGLEEHSIWMHLMISGVTLLFVSINFLGASVVGRSELFIVGIKVLILLAFGIIGLTTAEARSLNPGPEFDLGNLLLASGVVFMSYEGFGLVANTAEDIENPRKTLPRALYISVIVVMAIYLLVTVAVIGNLSVGQILEAKEYVLAEAAKPLLGSLGFVIMGIAALFSTSSAINATLYGPVHMLQETAKAGQAPELFEKPFRGHESGYALLITGALILLISNVLNLEAIAETGSMIFLIIYFMVNLANFKLRKETGSHPVLVLVAAGSMLVALCILIYHELTHKGLSVYILLAVTLLAFAYQWIHRKLNSL